jgi:predicted NAD/FAD-binding protein
MEVGKMSNILEIKSKGFLMLKKYYVYTSCYKNIFYLSKTIGVNPEKTKLIFINKFNGYIEGNKIFFNNYKDALRAKKWLNNQYYERVFKGRRINYTTF